MWAAHADGQSSTRHCSSVPHMLQQFLQANPVDEMAARALEAACPSVQRAVLAQGNLTQVVNRSAVLMSRLKRLQALHDHQQHQQQEPQQQLQCQHAHQQCHKEQQHQDSSHHHLHYQSPHQHRSEYQHEQLQSQHQHHRSQHQHQQQQPQHQHRKEPARHVQQRQHLIIQSSLPAIRAFFPDVETCHMSQPNQTSPMECQTGTALLAASPPALQSETQSPLQRRCLANSLQRGPIEVQAAAGLPITDVLAQHAPVQTSPFCVAVCQTQRGHQRNTSRDQKGVASLSARSSSQQDNSKPLLANKVTTKLASCCNSDNRVDTMPSNPASDICHASQLRKTSPIQCQNGMAPLAARLPVWQSGSQPDAICKLENDCQRNPSKAQASLERFLQANVVDEFAEKALRTACSSIQQAVIAQGTLTNANNSSAALMSRLRRAQSGGSCAVQLSILARNETLQVASLHGGQDIPKLDSKILTTGSSDLCTPASTCADQCANLPGVESNSVMDNASRVFQDEHAEITRDSASRTFSSSEAQLNQRASTPGSNAATSSVQLHTGNPSLPSLVDIFLMNNVVDEDAARSLRAANPEIQQAVLARGNFNSNCQYFGNYSAALMSRLKRAQLASAAQHTDITIFGLEAEAGACLQAGAKLSEMCSSSNADSQAKAQGVACGPELLECSPRGAIICNAAKMPAQTRSSDSSVSESTVIERKRGRRIFGNMQRFRPRRHLYQIANVGCRTKQTLRRSATAISKRTQRRHTKRSILSQKPEIIQDFSGCVPKYTSSQAQRLRQRQYGYTAGQAEQLHSIIREDRELWEAILVFEPVDLRTVLDRIRATGISFVGKMDLRALGDFFHDQGVIFQDTRCKEQWNSWRARWHVDQQHKRQRQAGHDNGSHHSSDLESWASEEQDAQNEEYGEEGQCFDLEATSTAVSQECQIVGLGGA